MKKNSFFKPKFFALIFLFLAIGAFAERTQEYPQKTLVADSKISEPLFDLLKIMQIKCDRDISCVVKETQKKWLRKNERWETDEIEIDRKRVIPLLEKLNYVNEIVPEGNEYDYCLLLGASFSSFESRMGYLTELLKKNVRFKELVFLGGKRPLADLEKKLILKKYPLEKMPENEIEMMRLVFDKSRLSEIEKIKLTFVTADLQIKNGQLVRPNTEDTLRKWLLENKPVFGKCLAVSNQPYIGYQRAVLKMVLNGFSVETVGRKALDDEKISIYLDSLARELYQEAKRLNL